MISMPDACVFFWFFPPRASGVLENPFTPEKLCIVHTGSGETVATVPETEGWVNTNAAPLVRFPTKASAVYTLRPCPQS